MDAEAWLGDVGRRALSHPSTIRFSYDSAADVVRAGVRGDLCEAGVFAGAQLAAAWRGAVDAGQRRRLLAIDSFQGIPEAGPRDAEQPGIGPRPRGATGRLVSSGVAVCGLDQFRGHLREWGIPWDDVDVLPGWFQDTLPTWPVRSLAWLRIDCDLYESTALVLRHLYPALEPGGVCIVDDYALSGCRAAVDEHLAQYAVEITPRPIEGGHGPVWWFQPGRRTEALA